MSSSRQRYSSIPRDGPCKSFLRLEPGSSSLRCGAGVVSPLSSVAALTSKSEHFKTLPTRRLQERVPLSSVIPLVACQPADGVDGNFSSHQSQYPHYASRMSRVNIKRRPSQPAKIDRYLVSGPSTDTMTTTKSSSLPGHTGHSPTLLDPLAVPPEDLASQLTLLDLPVFRNILPEELQSCAWNKKNKREVAPNIVDFTRRFNHVSFWTVQEILRHEDLKSRVDTMAHFIKVAKKLHELNNLHSEFAILCALQSAAVYRLSKTWNGLTKHTKQTFEKLLDLFSDRDNYTRLRDHMNSTALKHNPCIPYLGLYLTDLTMIDIAHPSTGGLESDHRRLKMNNVLRLVSELQQADYSHLVNIPAIQSYLSDIRYIDELQKFLEDDQFKLSERLEPNSPPVSSSSSKESVRVAKTGPGQHQHPDILSGLNLSPAKRAASGGKGGHKPFVPGHRKSKSEGGNIFFSCAGSGLASPEVGSRVSTRVASCDSLEQEKVSQYSLLDGSLLNDSSLSPPHLPPPPAFSPDSESQVLVVPHSPDEVESTASIEPGSQCTFQGCVQRKTLLKDGKRPLVSSWQRYWLQLWGSSLVFFLPKTLSKAKGRNDFKTEPCKLTSIEGWLVMVPENSHSQETEITSFQLADPVMRNVYRFRDGQDTSSWVYHLTRATRGLKSKTPPTNLMSFE